MITKKDKIIACAGHVNQRSTALLCNCTVYYVSVIWAEAGITYIKRNYHE